ncbi:MULTISPECIES: phycobilisome protein [Leptolyngbya]|uniref:Phycobilisome protein n=1 Tax=Leptolyngbya boryana CZ1 TaxID=3060204 RepID=A0AA96WTG6_LEPBY|nr:MULTISPECIES: phycobilisome protein [Leptolyngbya]MBD1854427.1 phycobilisome protein [Leptolyngbya sp. FACHB-1624]MBN8562344.1 phycobilisome protein [Leptolyngbya sp. UWPOB_LEPTO1]MCY6492413.1 phycobilisome protein [Leptolyngbya sp. GGD]WNZ45706.1 phycobilisome protein [Leptolyngbya boryana CZ1]
MLSQIQRLSQTTEGRYATDEELRFLAEYARSFELRVQTYQKLQASEAAIVQQVLAKMRAIDPTLLRNGSEDVTAKWKRDTLRVLRYSAVAMLLDDSETLRERFLFWFQTIMRAFNAQKSCGVTYTVMQEVVKQVLTPSEANLILPILEVNRRMLGTV